MEELKLNKKLYYNIALYMKPLYSINTSKQYLMVMKKMFKKYKVLNRDTLRRIVKNFKHQNQRATLVLINQYCFDNNIDFHINVPRIKKQPVKLPEILSHEEIKLMIQSAPKPYDLMIRCIFNIGAGLRISEVIKMSWNHIRWIDWLHNQDNYGVVLIKSGKGSKDRAVNIPKKLMHDLYEYAKEKNMLNEFRVPHGNMIFTFGNPDYKLDLMNIDIDKWKNEYVKHCYNWFRYNVLEKYCEKAINKRIKIHSLRHSKATSLYERDNIPVEKIQILLGHSSLNTTMLYTKVNPRSVFELIKNTDEL